MRKSNFYRYNTSMAIGKNYLDELTRRRKESHVYKKHQLIGLEIADLLGDRAHKSLYIKLAKNGNPTLLFRTAKEIAENGTVKNKGAYFMWMIHHQNKPILSSTPKNLRKKRSKKNSDVL